MFRKNKKVQTEGEVVVEGASNGEPTTDKFFKAGKVFSTISVILAIAIICLLVGTVLYPLVVALNYLVAIVIVIITIGTILIKVSFSDLILFKPSMVENFVPIVEKILPFVCYGCIALSIVSLVMMILSKKKGKIGRIVLAVITIALSVFACTVKF